MSRRLAVAFLQLAQKPLNLLFTFQRSETIFQRVASKKLMVSSILRFRARYFQPQSIHSRAAASATLRVGNFLAHCVRLADDTCAPVLGNQHLAAAACLRELLLKLSQRSTQRICLCRLIFNLLGKAHCHLFMA